MSTQQNNIDRPTRPLLRYFGGKWRQASWIVGQFPEHTKYVEPFGGGGSVLLSKSIVNAEVYNDLDGEIVNLFRVMRDNKDVLIEKIRLTPFSRTEFELSYGPCEDPIEQARRTMVRSWMGFSSQATSGARSGFRNNASREYTLPVHDWASLSPAMEHIAKRLQAVIIENRDALAVMRQFDSPTTLHYVDPPYIAQTRSGEYKDVYRHEMSDEQHVAMLDFIKGLKGMVILSGYPSTIYNDALKDWKKVTCNVMVGGRTQGGDLSREDAVWLSPTCVEAVARQDAQGGFDFGPLQSDNDMALESH